MCRCCPARAPADCTSSSWCCGEADMWSTSSVPPRVSAPPSAPALQTRNTGRASCSTSSAGTPNPATLSTSTLPAAFLSIAMERKKIRSIAKTKFVPLQKKIRRVTSFKVIFVQTASMLRSLSCAAAIASAAAFAPAALPGRVSTRELRSRGGAESHARRASSWQDWCRRPHTASGGSSSACLGACGAVSSQGSVGSGLAQRVVMARGRLRREQEPALGCGAQCRQLLLRTQLTASSGRRAVC